MKVSKGRCSSFFTFIRDGRTSGLEMSVDGDEDLASPLMDALYSAIFRMSVEELSLLEMKRHGCTADMSSTRSELLDRIYSRKSKIAESLGLCSRVNDLRPRSNKSFSKSLEDLRHASDEQVNVELMEVYHDDTSNRNGLLHDGDAGETIIKAIYEIGLTEDSDPHAHHPKPTLIHSKSTPVFEHVFTEKSHKCTKRPKFRTNTEKSLNLIKNGVTSQFLFKEGQGGRGHFKNNQKVTSAMKLFLEDEEALMQHQNQADFQQPFQFDQPTFLWKGLDTLVAGTSEQQIHRQLISLHRIITTKDRLALSNYILGNPELDLSLPLKGVTALSLSLYLQAADITRDLLRHMDRLGQVARAINVTSVDNAIRREPPLITAARTGQLEAVELLLRYPQFLNMEARDCQGRNALWHAVREEHVGIAMTLVTKGANVYYENGDMSCPLQLACKTSLLKNKGRKLAKFLVCHGANIDYVDHALRNGLYWSVYNACAEVAIFLIESGAQVRPWTWLENEALPVSILEDPFCSNYIKRVRNSPTSLKILARRRARDWVTALADKKSLFPVIDRLKIIDKHRAWLKLNDIRANLYIKPVKR